MEQLSEKSFQNQKKQTLLSSDLSRKGNIDKPIEDLVNFINSQDDFFTTSSCSGRIIVFSEGCEKKKGCVWIFVTHDKTTDEEVSSKLTSYNLEDLDVVTFKYEPFVLHCQCRTLEMAQIMLKSALDSGFRNSGLIIGKKKRIMLAVRSTHGIETPIAFDGKLMVSSEFISKVTAVANERFEENFRRIERFYTALRTELTKEKDKQI